MISKRISDDIPPQMKILNMVITILMHFCSFVSNWSVASLIMPDVIQRNVTLIMTSKCFLQYIAGYCRKCLTSSNQSSRYKSKCIRNVCGFRGEMSKHSLSISMKIVIQFMSEKHMGQI